MILRKQEEVVSTESKLNDLLAQQRELLTKNGSILHPLPGSVTNLQKTVPRYTKKDTKPPQTPSTQGVVVDNHFDVLSTLVDPVVEAENALIEQQRKARLFRSIETTAEELERKRVEAELFSKLDVYTLANSKCMICGKILNGIPFEWRDSANGLCALVLKPKKPLSCTRPDAIILDDTVADTVSDPVDDASESDDETLSSVSVDSCFTHNYDYALENLNYESGLRQWKQANKVSTNLMRLIYFVMLERVPTNKQMEQFRENRHRRTPRIG